MAQLLQNFADKLPDFAQRMVRGNAPVRLDVREHSALIQKSSTHCKSSRRISGKSESPPLPSGEVFPQTARSMLLGYSTGSAALSSWFNWESGLSRAADIFLVIATISFC